jgi:hypothetical protein
MTLTVSPWLHTALLKVGRVWPNLELRKGASRL